MVGDGLVDLDELFVLNAGGWSVRLLRDPAFFPKPQNYSLLITCRLFRKSFSAFLSESECEIESVKHEGKLGHNEQRGEARWNVGNAEPTVGSGV